MSKRLTASDIAFGIVLETTKAIETTQAMIRDAKLAAHAKHTASKHTECRQCQAGLENFILEFPDACTEAIDEKHRDIWEACPTCRAEYVQILHAQRCKHGNIAETCTDCLDEWADQNAPECDGILDKPSDWEVQNGY